MPTIFKLSKVSFSFYCRDSLLFDLQDTSKENINHNKNAEILLILVVRTKIDLKISKIIKLFFCLLISHVADKKSLSTSNCRIVVAAP